MSSEAIETLIKLMENLPEHAQNQVVDHMRDFIAEIEDETRWEVSSKNTQEKLISSAQRAKKEIADGQSYPMDYDRL